MIDYLTISQEKFAGPDETKSTRDHKKNGFCFFSYLYVMMLLTKSEKLYFDRMIAYGKIKSKEETAYQKLIRKIEKKLPINEN